MKCFAADVLRFFTEKRQNFAHGWLAEYSRSNLTISEIFLKFLSRSATREAIRIFAFW